MNIDFARPFQYVMEDKDWVKKVLIGGGIFFGSFVLSFLLVGLVGFLAIGGYLMRVAKNVADGKETPLPEFDNWGEDIVNGLKMFAIGFLWQLPGVLIRVVGTIAFVALAQAGEDAANVGGILMMGTTCIGLPLQLIGAIAAYLGIIRFYETGELAAGFRIGELIELVKSQAINLLLGIVIAMIAGFIANFGMIACIVGVFFTIFWAQLVNAHVIGQIMKLHRGTATSPSPMMRPAAR